jgi:integrase
MATGITKRHSKDCPGRDGGRCNCAAGYEASVWSQRDGKKIRKTFPTASAARSWRADALAALARGGLRTPKRTTVGEAWADWYEDAKSGTIRNKSGNRYKPSSLRDYERNMRIRVLPELGAVRLTDVRRPDLQEFADGLLAVEARSVHDPHHLPPAAGDLPSRGGEGRGCGEPLHRPRAASRAWAP